MPSPDETKKFFAGLFDRVAPTYDDVDADFFTTFGERLVAHARLNAGATVLDVGSGRGAVLRPAARAIGPDGRVVGFDLSPAMVAATARDLDEHGPANATIAVGDADDPPTTQGGWDAITAGLVVFFLPDAPSTLQAWHEALSEAGTLAMSTFADDDRRWDVVFAAFTPYLPEGMVASQLPATGWHRTDDGVTQTLAAAGFSEIASTTESHVTEFRDTDHWIAFSYSNGMRAYWESVGDDVRPAMLADVTSALNEIAEPDGSLRLLTGVRYTTATA